MASVVRTVFEVTYDGKVFVPDEPVELEPNTRVRVKIVEALTEEEPPSFLKVARSLRIDGPPDWSENLDKYLNEDILSTHDE